MNITAKEMMRVAISQRGYIEGRNNNTKYGKWIGANYQAWCASYVSWVGYEASRQFGDSNVIPYSSNAANLQDWIVSKCGGKWIMPKTASNTAKKNGFKKAKFGDIVDFDFGKNNLYRQHIGICIGKIGNYYVTIEGNTSPQGVDGSQNNGDGVYIRRRHYTDVCSIARPKYGKEEKYTPKGACPYELPFIPKKGYFDLGHNGANVKHLQQALNWSVNAGIKADGEFGNLTLFAVYWFQYKMGLTMDGQFGKECLIKLKELEDKYAKKTPQEGTDGCQSEEKPQVDKLPDEPANSEKFSDKIVDMAKKCAWKYDTPKKTYSYPDGRPKTAYKKALDKAYPDRSKWGKQTRAGASCDVFVGTVLRASGVDPKFPRGLDEVEPYMAKNKDKWEKTSIKSRDKMKPGYIIYELYKGGGGHISIYLGGNRIANAHYNGKTYPRIQSYTGQIHDASKCQKFIVYRRKEK